ncbi:FecCD family ABC transporter permease [Vibrio tritonius]|uniref:FecCD family ABC transporter permease n=1 Tax=Vibrio tritonius TaxID=1435069 RepID=UPI0008381EA4|nr:iron ABC transporter permease [Vibrio tritonius]
MRLLIGVSLLLALSLLHLMSGARPIPPWDIWHAFTEYDGKNYAHVIVIYQRLTRLVVAISLGAMLGLAGYILQKLFRNDLVSPSTLGINSGASAFTIMAVYFLGNGVISLFWPALIGAIAALFLTFYAANLLGSGQKDPLNLALGGMISSSLFAGIATFILSLDPDKFGQIISWLVGDIGIFDYQTLAYFWPVALVCVLILFLLSRSIDILTLGHDQAAAMGLSPQKVQAMALACSVILSVVAVTVSGPIGFIGLVVPHIVRLLVKDYGRQALVWVMLLGSCLLTSADIIARTIFAPQLLNVGTVMALFGGLSFLLIILVVLRRRQC